MLLESLSIIYQLWKTFIIIENKNTLILLAVSYYHP